MADILDIKCDCGNIDLSLGEEMVITSTTVEKPRTSVSPISSSPGRYGAFLVGVGGVT